MTIGRVLLAGAVALGAVVGMAPAAQATTTGSCANAVTYTAAPSEIQLGNGCQGLADQGGPYVFTITWLTVLFTPRPISGPLGYNVGNVVATCTGYTTGTYTTATGCHWPS
jgi:hypothetical protein